MMRLTRMRVSGVLIAALVMVSGCVLAPLQGTGDPEVSMDNRVVTFMVTGKGIAPENALNKGQAILMAEKAAVADGYRQLVERLRGVYVDAYQKTGKGVVDYDIIQTHTQAWLRGTEITEVRQADFGITEAVMRLRVNFTRRGPVWWPVGTGPEVVQAPFGREPAAVTSAP
jgi:hypothetical protein